ncbi:leiomodin-2 [Camelus ferus]|nr:leiomodin-2 [Camelus ferus]
MSTFGYRRGLSKYESIDEDELLASLSAEELKELERELEDIEPDRSLPVGMRQKSLTEKTPTGTFSREALMAYWEKESQKLLEKERLGECGKVAEEDKEESEEELVFTETNSEVSEEVSRPKTFKSQIENIQLTNGHSGRSTESPAAIHPCGNPTVIEDALEKVKNNDPATTEVNLNNIENITSQTLARFAEALRNNTVVKTFSLANTHADDSAATAIAEMLRVNRHITSVNIESNFITGKGILAIMRALQHNAVLTELRFHNQRHIMGSQVEMEIVKLLRENTTLLRLGYHFELPGPRMSMTSLLTRNMDKQRQKRMQEQKQQEGSDGGANLRTKDEQAEFQHMAAWVWHRQQVCVLCTDGAAGCAGSVNGRPMRDRTCTLVEVVVEALKVLKREGLEVEEGTSYLVVVEGLLHLAWTEAVVAVQLRELWKVVEEEPLFPWQEGEEGPNYVEELSVNREEKDPYRILPQNALVNHLL